MRIPYIVAIVVLSLTCTVALAAPPPQTGQAACGCGHCAKADQPAGQHHGMSGGHQGRADRTAAPNRGMGDSHFQVMGTIHFLIDHHEQIVREVEQIEGGVLTTTRSPKNAELVPEIQKHVREMWNLLETGSAFRRWDPLFRELFARADQIQLTYEDLEDGIRVREVSADPEVTELIRAHAAKVNEFVARGREAMHEETPLPTNQ